jgi:DNA-binding transcriptional MerR regulator
LDKAPDAFRTISEVADDLDIPQHVLRFWETRFVQIKPMKRSGGRRYYRPDDVDLLRGIRRLLYGEGYTIRGVQRILKEQGIKAVQALASGSIAPLPRAAVASGPHDADVDAHAHDQDDAELLLESEEPDEDDAEDAEDVAPVPARREPLLLRPTSAPHADEAAASARSAMANEAQRQRDQARLQAALQDLLHCRQLLDRAMETG